MYLEYPPKACAIRRARLYGRKAAFWRGGFMCWILCLRVISKTNIYFLVVARQSFSKEKFRRGCYALYLVVKVRNL